MDNLEKYQNVFLEAFETEKEILDDLKYQDIPEWDSMGHMTMISLLEDEFETTGTEILRMDQDDDHYFYALLVDKQSGRDVIVKFNFNVT